MLLLLLFLFIRYHRTFNKKSGPWSVFPLKEKQTYHHIPSIVASALDMQLQSDSSMPEFFVMHPSDPRRIARNVYGIEPETTVALA